MDVCVADLVFHKRANLTPPFRCIVLLVGRIEDGVWDLGGSLSFRVGCPIAYGSATAIPSTGQVRNWCRQQPPTRDGMACSEEAARGASPSGEGLRTSEELIKSGPGGVSDD